LKAYSEDPDMADKLQEYFRRRLDEIVRELPLEKRFEGLSPEELRKRLSTKERLEGLSPEERLEGLSPDQLRATVEAAQRKLQPNGTSPKPE
jgi:hypothetical protein